MKLKGKEKEVEDHYLKHLELIGQCLDKVVLMFETYLKGDEHYREISKEVHDTESQADKERRNIERHLHRGAFFSVMRGDFIALAETLDRVANAAEALADAVTLQRPTIPAGLQEEFLGLVQSSTDAFQPFRELENLFEEDVNKMIACAEEVESREAATDKKEWKLKEKIFDMGELELAHKLQLRYLTDRIAAISDRAEDASDSLETIVAKMMI